MKTLTGRGVLSPEARAASSRPNALVSIAILAVAVLLALVAGKAIAEDRAQVAILSVGALAGLAVFRYLSLAAWCALILATAVTARGLTTLLGLPEIVNFFHYPVVALFALAAADRPRRDASHGPGLWIVGFLLVVLLSAVAHPSNPLRTLLFIVIAGEPLLVIWAISRWGADQQTLRSVGVVTLGLAAIQIPIGVLQGLSFGWFDPVQGTLSGHGAGHHVLGALFALGLFIVAAAILSRKVSLTLGSLGAAVCFGMILATGSMAVLVVASFAAFLMPFIAPSRSFGGAGSGRRASTIVLAVLLGTSVLAFVAALIPGFFERAIDLATSPERPGLEIIQDQAAHDPLALFLGSGPGTTASRASLLLVNPRPGSPREFVGLEPTDLGRELLAATSDETQGGSVESAASSALGIVGDLGLVGLVGMSALLFGIWRGTGRSGSWLAPAARSSLLLIGALSLVDNWLEYPEFALPFAILVGFVLSDARGRGTELAGRA